MSYLGAWLTRAQRPPSGQAPPKPRGARPGTSSPSSGLRCSKQGNAPTSVTLAHAVDEWLCTSEVEESTRAGYVNNVQRYMRPTLGTDGEHDCAASVRKPHTCKPLAAATVRQIHSVLIDALLAAERWGLDRHQPARVARCPRLKPPEPDPPTPAEAASPKKRSAWMTMGPCGLRFSASISYRNRYASSAA